MNAIELATELRRHQETLNGILDRFERAEGDVRISQGDEMLLLQTVQEIIDLLADALGPKNRYRLQVQNYYNEGIENYLNSPSYTSVEQILTVLRAAITRVEREGDAVLRGNASVLSRNSPSPTMIGASEAQGDQSTRPSHLVFVSWSGSLSHKVALVLKGWIEALFPATIAWVSTEDIAKGSRWNPKVADTLEEATFGIACLVPGNQREPWVIFEAGAVSKAVEESKLAPFLLSLSPSDLPGPLSQFQCSTSGREELLKLARSVNDSLGPSGLVNDELSSSFDRLWPRLDAELKPLKQEADELAVRGLGRELRLTGEVEIRKEHGYKAEVKFQHKFGLPPSLDFVVVSGTAELKVLRQESDGFIVKAERWGDVGGGVSVCWTATGRAPD